MPATTLPSIFLRPAGEGALVFADSGQLDLGLIRDTILTASNKAEFFYESFECVPKFGTLSYWITSSLCSDGASQIATNIASRSPQNSRQVAPWLLRAAV
jgi:hypothetical protein